MKKLLSLGLLAITLLGVTACTSGQSIAASTVAIDVNPSIVLELDEDDKVINIIKNNEDADAIIGDMDLIGVDYNIAINALIGSMVSKGYISDIANSILLSVQNDDETKENELMDTLAQAVEDTLNTNDIVGSIITQDLEFTSEAEEMALELGISEAKAELIIAVIEADPRMNSVDLSDLSINDLNLLLEARNIILENVEKSGSASELGLISATEAFQKALEVLVIDETEVVEYEVELEQEDGIMVFEIEIETATDEYEILIDAKEGSVYVEVDEDDEEDEDEHEDVFPVDALTEEQVMDLIATVLGLDQSLITELEVEEEIDNSIAYYEIEFEYNDKEYELEVDALTGDVYSNSMDENGFDHQDDDDDIDTDDEDDHDSDDVDTETETDDTEDESNSDFETETEDDEDTEETTPTN